MTRIRDNHPNEDELVKLEKLIQCLFCLISLSNLEISVHFVVTNFQWFSVKFHGLFC